MMPSRQVPEFAAPADRESSFAEVRKALKPHEAMVEAGRCLFCHDAPCVKGCPAGVDVPGFIRRMAQRNFVGAARVIRRSNPMAAICGRVCPSEALCEKKCSSCGISQPIAIRDLQRFVCDQEMQKGIAPVQAGPPTGKAVAVIGAGPAGLACALRLVEAGHEVRVYEESNLPGGTVRTGIPRYRLPHDVYEREMSWLMSSGIEYVPLTKLGVDLPFDEIMKSHDAVFLGIGLGEPENPNLPGDEVTGVISAYAFLKAVSSGITEDMWQAIPDPLGRVVVLGGGNVAMDAACTARRLGASSVLIAYRRTEEDMPAWPGEIEFAREEGVDFLFLTAPLEVIGADGKVVGVRMSPMIQGEPDSSGRRRPVPKPDAEPLFIGADTVMLAFGQGANPASRAIPGLRLEDHGAIWVDTATKATSLPGVFAGGDGANGGLTVVAAVADGITAAQSINEYLTKPR